MKEIAEKLGVPDGTVKWRLSEGRKKLRKGYGIVEQEYDENELLVRRVMRQVEELKLWALKNDKSGFEADYRSALAAVETIDESKDKHRALSDVLIRGYWWIPGEKNAEMLKRIKGSAEIGHNEDVMMSVAGYEFGPFDGERKIDFMLNSQIPYLKRHGFVKTQAYVWFWMGREYLRIDIGKARECFEKAKSLLHPIDVYYANAIAALRIIPKIKGSLEEYYSATGELLRLIDGKWYFWSQPGFGDGEDEDEAASVFYGASFCDRLLFDGTMKPGEKRVASDGWTEITFESDNVTVDTPAGRFTNCLRFVTDRKKCYYSLIETDFQEGVGIVRQKITTDVGNVLEWKLSSFTIRGGEGYLPFASGNRWEYVNTKKREGHKQGGTPTVYEVIGKSDDAVSIAGYTYHGEAYDLDTFEGNFLCARYGYYKDSNLIDVLPYFEKAKELAKTKREKLLAEIGYDVMYRILYTLPSFNPDYSEFGRWNFFNLSTLSKKDGTVMLTEVPDSYHFEFKDMTGTDDEGYPLFHNFLYDIFSDATDGVIYDEKWVPGAHFEKIFTHWGVEYSVKIDVERELKRIETPAGVFGGCQTVTIDLHGPDGGHGYRGGVKYYSFAPGVGIIEMKAPYGDGRISLWNLTEYRGTGEGFFPVVDGIFRRYEAQNLKKGYHGSVEYTFLEDEQGFTLFRNALGTQDRKDYETINS